MRTSPKIGTGIEMPGAKKPLRPKSKSNYGSPKSSIGTIKFKLQNNKITRSPPNPPIPIFA